MSLNDIAIAAAREGHRNIVEDMIRRGADNYIRIAIVAARGGYLDIVDDMIQRGANDDETINEIAGAAAEGGHEEIVEDMIRLEADDYNGIIRAAEEEDHMGIVNNLTLRDRLSEQSSNAMS